jgi:hypothetical protein
MDTQCLLGHAAWTWTGSGGHGNAIAALIFYKYHQREVDNIFVKIFPAVPCINIFVRDHDHQDNIPHLKYVLFISEVNIVSIF